MKSILFITVLCLTACGERILLNPQVITPEPEYERRAVTDEQRSNVVIYTTQLLASYPTTTGDDPDYAAAIEAAHRAAQDLYGEPVKTRPEGVEK